MQIEHQKACDGICRERQLTEGWQAQGDQLQPSLRPHLGPCAACLRKHAQLRLGGREVEEAAIRHSIPNGVPPGKGRRIKVP